MKFKQNSQFAFQFYLIGMPLIFIFSLFDYVRTDSLNPLMLGFLLVYGITVLYVIRYYGMLSLYAIYLYTSAFFLYDCFVFSLFSDKNFLLQTFPIRLYISEKSGAIFIMACFVTVYVTHLAYCLIPKTKYKQKRENYSFGTNKSLEKTGIALMLIFIIPVMYKIYMQLNFVKTNGYTSIFDGSMSDIHYPFWCAGSFIFFIGGYVTFFTSRPPKKLFIPFTLLFLLVYGFNSLKGQRGPIISAILVVIFLITKQYDVKIKMKHLVLLFVIIVFIICTLGTVRSDYGNKKKKKTIVDAQFVTEIFYGQTTSRIVPLLIIDRKLDYHSYPFIFSPLLEPYYSIVYHSEGQDKVSAEHYNNISQVTTYNVSKRSHLNGNGLGGAFIAEAYDCGSFIGVVFWSIILAVILMKFDYVLKVVSVKYRPLVFFYLLNIPALPRGRFFGFMSDFNKILFVYIVMLVVNMHSYLKIKEKNVC